MSEIKPALTAEEWARKYHYMADLDPVTGNLRVTHSDGEGFVVIDGSESGKFERHALAALALYNQPFGFTREDVKRVRAAAQMLEYRLPVAGISDERVMSEVEQLRSLADRIEALLPKEGA